MLLEPLAHSFFVFGDNATALAVRSSVWVYSFYGGLAAGTFEESDRLFAFYIMLRKKQES